MWKSKDHAEGADKAANLAKAKALLDACAISRRGHSGLKSPLQNQGLNALMERQRMDHQI